MALYVCRNDGEDLTDEVARAVADKGGDIMRVDVVVEGRPVEGDFGSEGSLFGELTERREDLEPVAVICPKCEKTNVFLVRLN